jgi:mannose-1-phosphate guanylyltransferase
MSREEQAMSSQAHAVPGVDFTAGFANYRSMPSRRPPRSAPRRVRLPRYAVIMAGGHGTRFWPRSRQRLPKHLLSITGRQTLLQDTARRLCPLSSLRRLLIVTNTAHAAEVRRQLPRLAPEQVLIEPVGRNTLACIALAAASIAAGVPDAIMIVAPSDHAIKDTSAFRKSLEAACVLAASHDCLVTLGVEPTRADTGYGYVQVGRAIAENAAGAHWVRRFHEKPSSAVAKRYVANGRYLWNSGIFVWKVSAFHQALERCAPQVRRALGRLWNGQAARTRSGRASEREIARAYRRLPAVSVDVAVMQHLTALRQPQPRVAVVPARFDWNDVGTWVAVPELWGYDKAGNAALGPTLPIDAHDCIVYSPQHLVALLGVKDLIVVESDDALLVCARDRAQDVRQITDALKKRGWSRYL